MKHTVLVLTFLMLVGCNQNLDAQVASLVESKNKWIHHTQGREYTFTYMHTCYCEYSGKEILIRATDDKVISAKISHSPIDTSSLPTMKQLFIQVFDVIKRQELEGGVTVSAKYNSKYGNPEVIVFKRLGADSTKRIYITNVNVTQGNEI